MKIAITGANGFEGASLCRYFHNAGHQVIAIGRTKNPHPNLLNYASYLQADILKPIVPLEADVCIHSASLKSDTASYKDLFLSNVEGTLNVVEASKYCSHVIHISSSAVYEFGDSPAKEIDASIENDLTDYGETKLLSEEILHLDIPLAQKRLILRPRAIYGIGDRVLLPRLFNLLKRKTIFCPVESKIKTSLTNIKNVGYAIQLFLNQKELPNLQVFNIADEHVYSLQDEILKLLTEIEEEQLNLISIPGGAINILTRLNSKLKFIRNLNPVLIQSISRNAILDTFCIRKELNYNPENNFQNSRLEIAQWVKNMGGKNAYLSNLAMAPWL
ncbi:NAD-dependent epimerase/dehydratase family protein [Daejeonella oryzae]|uniref:NAD-dependent epimerase/dehydratase family protein n=1 Tax=Daejeonella oryzae TaxID=1122943 RepID=UPI00041F6358|nr:NAD(P)-dependent oxidoreductase [Daejeonella oryzae]